MPRNSLEKLQQCHQRLAVLCWHQQEAVLERSEVQMFGQHLHNFTQHFGDPFGEQALRQFPEKGLQSVAKVVNLRVVEQLLGNVLAGREARTSVLELKFSNNYNKAITLISWILTFPPFLRKMPSALSASPVM